ncbi:MAG TPA: M43 family zinc metalloprotease [Cyclobacteriaceae bacterium]|nr:M43 family zinc metalloprotease [Cyclobacteriaceae bacterium]
MNRILTVQTIQSLMIRFTVFLIFISLNLFPPLSVCAQDRCSTMEYEKMLHPNRLNREVQFEQWMDQKIRDSKTKVFGIEKIQSTYTIPVVVHIIHNGEPVGSGTNISDAQIQSQMTVLNNDFNRLNSDSNKTPAEFLPVAGSLNIQFVLAKQDPEGLPTTGITRNQGTKTSWSLTDNSELKAINYWPAENYLNIWVANFSGSGLIGYSQMPVSNLPGLEESSLDRLTDGVIVNYREFGSIADGSFNLDSRYNKGRTATHEIGHTFGLRHIWGDGSCATDYVSDTPFQLNQTTDCPVHPQLSCESPNPHKMFQNYLDYTYDDCMNIFTAGQVARMIIVLQNSPRRASLTTSPGATVPVQVANDLGIRRIITPSAAECTNPAVPQIEVRNYGTNTITSAQVEIRLNGSLQELKSFSSLNLSPDQLTTLSFNSFVPSSGVVVSFQVTQTNGGADGKSSNDAASVQVTVPGNITLPFNEPFNSFPAGWSINNPDGDKTWINTLAPDNNSSNKAMSMKLADYINNAGSIDWLLTPSFNVATPLSTQLRFDVAYSQVPGLSDDKLRVYALPACNPDLSQGILLYDKSGSALSTAPYISGFVPTSSSQWRKSEVIALNTLIGSSKWQLAFISTNGYGNNLYVDNVQINDQVVNDVALTNIASPGLVHCQTSPAIQFNVKNFSTSPVTSFQVRRIVNGGTAVTQTFSNISLAVGEERTFTLNTITLQDGKNQISLTVDLPNGLPDTSPSNNILAFNSYLDKTKDATPLRENFDDGLQVPWVIASPLNSSSWESVHTHKNQSIVFQSYINTSLADQSWLASPVLDLSRYSQQGLFFDLSYALNGTKEDRLKLIASTDCGLTYGITLFDRSGTEFSSGSSTSAWVPATDGDWKRQYIELDTLSGKSNIRLALVVSNANGNNMYVDNIEIFAGTDSNPPVSAVPYQLYYSTHNTSSDIALTFNLAEKKDVRMQIFSVMGQLIVDNMLPDTLNQTYYFDFSQQASGIYLFRMQIDNQVHTSKAYIGH